MTPLTEARPALSNLWTMLDALVFDIDGTILDSNPAHVAAWAEAFEEFGYPVAPDRIEREIGMGGDRLVAQVLGDAAEATYGDQLRARQTDLLLQRVRRSPVAPLAGAIELLDAVRERGVAVALATSSTRAHLDALLASARLDLCAHADVVVTRGPQDASKPAPDLIVKAVEALGLAPSQCAAVGDTRFDGIAACRAGVTFLAVRSGGKTAAELFESGARGVWRDAADLLDQLDVGLHLASPVNARLTSELLMQLMHSALEEAREALRAGESPVGCILADGDRRIVSAAHHEVAATGDPTAHAELRAIRGAEPTLRDCGSLILVTTLEPCVMCLGAATLAGVDTVAYGLSGPLGTRARAVRPSPTGHDRLPRIVGGVLASESRALFSEWLLAGTTISRGQCGGQIAVAQ
ncbi:MAG TPA: HAD hydrolase-like protein [Gemmatimonadales bacterium]|nr:HAD hydrolase-like protein [Gemmatimonadales bacterium]